MEDTLRFFAAALIGYIGCAIAMYILKPEVKFVAHNHRLLRVLSWVPYVNWVLFNVLFFWIFGLIVVHIIDTFKTLK